MFLSMLKNISHKYDILPRYSITSIICHKHYKLVWKIPYVMQISLVISMKIHPHFANLQDQRNHFGHPHSTHLLAFSCYMQHQTAMGGSRTTQFIYNKVALNQLSILFLLTVKWRQMKNGTEKVKQRCLLCTE